MRANQCCVLTTTESRAKIRRQSNAFKPPAACDAVCFKRVVMMFNALPIVGGSSVFVIALLCITL